MNCVYIGNFILNNNLNILEVLSFWFFAICKCVTEMSLLYLVYVRLKLLIVLFTDETTKSFRQGLHKHCRLGTI